MKDDRYSNWLRIMRNKHDYKRLLLKTISEKCALEKKNNQLQEDLNLLVDCIAEAINAEITNECSSKGRVNCHAYCSCIECRADLCLPVHFKQKIDNNKCFRSQFTLTEETGE